MTPLIYTSKGNVPIDSLRYAHEWLDGPDMTVLKEYWYDGDEVVKSNVHAMAKKGLVIGGEQAQM